MNNLTGKYICEDFVLPTLIDCRTSATVEIRSKLWFKQHDIILTKEPSVSARIMKPFTSEKILLHHYVLGYEIDLYFPSYKLSIKVDQKRHKDRNKYKEFERQKAIEKELNCKFTIINPDGEDLYMYVEISKIYNYINKSN